MEAILELSSVCEWQENTTAAISETDDQCSLWTTQVCGLAALMQTEKKYIRLKMCGEIAGYILNQS